MCMYKLVMSMCNRSPSVLDPQEIYVCYSHSYRRLVCFLKLQQLMLLALEVPGVIYSELSKMVSVTQEHRCPHKHAHCKFLLHASAEQTEITIDIGSTSSCGGNRKKYSPKRNGSTDAVSFQHSFWSITVSSLSSSP